MSYGLTDEGFTAPRAADFLALIRDGYVQRASDAMGVSITVDWDADVFLGVVTAIMADQLGGEGEALQAVYDAWSPSNASGVQLDNLAQLVGIARLKASYSTVTVTCTAEDGTVILEGSLVEGGGPNGTTRWAATADGTAAGGFVDVLFQAQDAGAIEVEAGEIATIVTNISKWSAVTNAAKGTPGKERESDSALRKRRATSLQTSGSRSLNAIRANLLEVDGVQAAIVVDNPTMAPATVQGISVSPAGVGVVLYPSTMTDDQKVAAATVIYANVAGGIATSGDQQATVTGADGFAKTVNWYWAAAEAVVVAISVDLDTGYVLEDVEQPLIDLVADYFLGLAVGAPARMLAVAVLAASLEGITGASVTFNAVGADLVVDLTTILTLDSCSVTS